MSPALRFLVLAAALLFAVSAKAQTTLGASPTTVAASGSVTATWSGVPSPSAWDWIALFTPGAPDGSYSAWTYTGTTTPGGSLAFTIPGGTAPGTYQLRLFSGGVKRATSNNFSVLRAVTGTVTLGGSPLAGVAFTASNGGVCTTSNASGVYFCAVANGWSGTVTPTPTGYTFTPTSRSYSNVTTNQTGQNYTAVPYRLISGTVTFNGLPLANVAFGTGGAGSCTASNASGQYSCSVPDGWTGSVTPSQTGYAFIPSSKSYTAISANDPGEDYTASLSSPTSNISFIHADHLNTPRVVANAAGTTVWRWDQVEPFGVNVANEDPDGNSVTFEFPLRFPGQYFDKETGLAQNWHRDYWSEGGRYIQSDPVGLLSGLNTYAYVYSRPIMLFDITGRQAFEGGDMLPGNTPFPNAPRAPYPCAKGVADAWWITSGQQGWRRNDKRLHCVISCEIKKKCGVDVSIGAGIGRELYQLYLRGDYKDDNLRADSGADEMANRYGLTCPPDVNCYQHCIGKY